MFLTGSGRSTEMSSLSRWVNYSMRWGVMGVACALLLPQVAQWSSQNQLGLADLQSAMSYHPVYGPHLHASGCTTGVEPPCCLQVASMSLNCIRLVWSVEAVLGPNSGKEAAKVPAEALKANTDLVGRYAGPVHNHTKHCTVLVQVFCGSLHCPEPQW